RASTVGPYGTLIYEASENGAFPEVHWLDERRTWPGAATTKALLLNRRGGRLSARAASDDAP
ncbi:hypothetical protein AB0K48_40410, partial [Nonomuraea sp. NPDC055795]